MEGSYTDRPEARCGTPQFGHGGPGLSPPDNLEGEGQAHWFVRKKAQVSAARDRPALPGPGRSQGAVSPLTSLHERGPVWTVVGPVHVGCWRGASADRGLGVGSRVGTGWCRGHRVGTGWEWGAHWGHDLLRTRQAAGWWYLQWSHEGVRDKVLPPAEGVRAGSPRVPGRGTVEPPLPRSFSTAVQLRWVSGGGLQKERPRHAAGLAAPQVGRGEERPLGPWALCVPREGQQSPGAGRVLTRGQGKTNREKI